uniref:Peptidase S8/S53 domain-containing protein n=1 Tax=Amphimedon queenslandica TaxID=400682 RepID=A0A1X7TFY6_AMPQE
MTPSLFLLALTLTLSIVAADVGAYIEGQAQLPVAVFTDSWAVEVHGGIEAANEIAERHGFTNMGRVGAFANIYHFKMSSSIHSVNENIKSGTEVQYMTSALKSEIKVGYVQQQSLHNWEKKYIQPTCQTDPLWCSQWTVNNTGQTNETNLYLDLNAEPAWIQGYTGNGILVGVVDDGVQHNHTDLRNNYVSASSYNFNENISDPSPPSGSSHGTACAGEIVMARDNNVCGVGVAYDASVAGLRLLGGDITDITVSSALSYSRDNIDIYSNSWGPPDSGFTIGGPGYLSSLALKEGAEMGRNGRGNIVTFAAGNGGGFELDTCAADGYSQSIYAISVGAYAQDGAPASYDEKCSAKQTVAYVENTRTIDSDTNVAFDTDCITDSATKVIMLCRCNLDLYK